MYMNTPNTLTLIRIAMIPLFIAVFLSGCPNYEFICLALFIGASLTDLLDGYIARRDNLVTNFGKIIDPLADKLLVFSALILFVQVGRMPAWIVLILLARELAITSLRAVAASDGIALAAAKSGKLKTGVQIVGCCVLLISPISSLGFGGITMGFLANATMLAVAIYSGTDYLYKNRTLLKNSL
jgi:CDP-diacylglycerol--glycerol-3-phosphate 3-phosphatidyltransferase